MLEHFIPRHVPILFLSTIIIFSSAMPLYDPEKTCQTFGFPQRITVFKAAQPPMIVGSARVSVMGIALWGLYLGNHLEVMNTVCASMAWLAAVDVYVCWKESDPKTAAARFLSAGLPALWGFMEMTAGK